MPKKSIIFIASLLLTLLPGFNDLVYHETSYTLYAQANTNISTTVGNTEDINRTDSTIDTDISAVTDSCIPSGYIKMAETDIIGLYYNPQEPAIIVEDKRNGFLWGSSVSEEYYDMQSVNKAWQTNMKSLFNIVYTDLSRDTDTLLVTSSTGAKAQVNAQRTDNGFNIHYYFEELDIEVTLEFKLDGDALLVKLPADTIKERGKYGIVRIELLPFFGAAKDDEEGYVFYPDGCGAITYLKTKETGVATKYSWYVYGSDEVDIDLYKLTKEEGLKQALLPVFGIKRGNSGFVGIVTEGECDTAISFAPNGYVVHLARVYPEFTYRRFYRATRPDATLISRIEKEILLQDHAVMYVFLAGENANYSGMANAYRNYLLDTGNIKRVIKPGTSIPLAIDFLMGIKEKQLLFDRFIVMTTFDQVRLILDEFLKHGIKDMQVNLFGWTKGGYGSYPLHFPIPRSIGGIKGLKNLAEYTSEKGITLFLQDNFVDALAENGGFSKRKDVVYQKNGLSVTDVTQTEFLLNPTVSWNKFISEFLPLLGNCPIDGINFERLGEIIYFDYHNTYPSTRSKTAEYWQKFLERSNTLYGKSAVCGGNAYVLKYADRLFDIPIEGSGYFITDEFVPFYQIVVHGLIPYSSKPGNLFYDFQKQKLQWVEYGCLPYFQLTYNTPELLKYTRYNKLFTSFYYDWIKPVANIYREFNDRLGDIWSRVVIKHEKVQDNVYKVTYDGGARVYVNYQKQPVKVDGYLIEALDYLVIDEEGNVR